MTDRSLPVVITRPVQQAGPLAARIKEIGREAIVFPLLEIRPLEDQQVLRRTLAALDDYAMVAFVSPNAIDAAFSLVASWPANVDIAVMGEGSRIALARHGVNPSTTRILAPVDPLRTDSQTLLDRLDVVALRGRRVLIVRGENGRELLADALRDAGVLVDQVAAYRRIAPELGPQGRATLARLLDGGADWVITSSEALRILVHMVRDTAGDAGMEKIQQQRLVAPHVRIEETARTLGFANIMRTASGDDPIVAALQFQA